MSWRLPGIEDGTFAQRLLAEGRDWLEGMRRCRQDPVHHAEGDVLTHTLLVCARLAEDTDFQALPDDQRQILAWAALLHDVAKPRTTVVDQEGRITAPGHAEKGAVTARCVLWEAGCPFALREQICGLVHFHMKVFWALEKPDPTRLVREISLRCRCDHLALLARADGLGRKCDDTLDLMDRVELFRQLARESGCLSEPAGFASPTARFRYFQNRWHTPEHPPYEDFRCRVLLMSGLPGAGKDTWIQNHGPAWPVISLDAIRAELGVSPASSQGKVIEVARERARQYLRQSRDFIWNATNVGARMRQKPLSLFLEYGAHVTVVYLEVNLETLDNQNRDRDAMVPWKVVEGLLDKWDVPALTEAHEVVWVIP